MKGFFWYPTIGIIVLLPSFIAVNFSKTFNDLGYINMNLSLIFHYSFLSIFIMRMMLNKRNHIPLIIIFSFFLCLIIFFLITKSITRKNDLAYTISNFGLIVFCILYYYQLFNNLPLINLRKEPSFWIITGVTFSMSVQIPIQAAENYLHWNTSLNNYLLFISITMFCYSIMHLFFIKAYLCATHPQKA